VLDYKSASVERCGAEVACRIAASDRPVLIVSHSKGCLDTLEALLSLRRDGRLSNVAGWIAIQGPFAGAPEADDIAGNRMRRIGTKVALNCLGAHFGAVEAMRSSSRQEYIQAHRTEIESLVARLPIVSFSSWREDAKKPGTDG